MKRNTTSSQEDKVETAVQCFRMSRVGVGWIFWWMVWFGLVSWHINLCRLFNAKALFLEE